MRWRRCYISGEASAKFVVLRSRLRDWLVVGVAVALFVTVTYAIAWPPVHSFFAGL